MSSDVETEAGEVLGPYRLEEALGEGQMGVVYRAVRASDQETVALKVLRPELSQDAVFLLRFEREGKIASSLEHPHVVPVVDRGSAGGRHYLASRYISGRSLSDQLGAAGPLELEELVRVIAHVGAALDAIHLLGLVHRDIKPSNVMLDEQGNALLTDFGVARGEADTSLTQAGRTVGTVDYLAPEVIRGDRAAPASDIYGLGCVAYECATGSPPFAEKKTIAEVCVAHLQEEPPDPSRKRRDLPLPLVAPLLCALAKDPAGRPGTGTAYARLLGAGAKSR